MVFILVLYPTRIAIWSVGFCVGRKTGVSKENPLVQRENQQKSQPIYGTEPESNPSGHNGETRGLSPLHHLYFPSRNQYDSCISMSSWRQAMFKCTQLRLLDTNLVREVSYVLS